MDVKDFNDSDPLGFNDSDPLKTEAHGLRRAEAVRVVECAGDVALVGENLAYGGCLTVT